MTTDTRATDLIAFYAARLDEDEAAADAAGGTWDARTLGGDLGPGIIEGPGVFVRGAQPTGRLAVTNTRPLADHMARHDPARALRKVAAGRAAIKRYERAVAAAARGSVSGFVHGQDDGYAEACLDAIRDAVAAWDGHPDYDPAWRMDP